MDFFLIVFEDCQFKLVYGLVNCEVTLKSETQPSLLGVIRVLSPCKSCTWFCSRDSECEWLWIGRIRRFMAGLQAFDWWNLTPPPWFRWLILLLFLNHQSSLSKMWTWFSSRVFLEMQVDRWFLTWWTTLPCWFHAFMELFKLTNPPITSVRESFVH